MPEPLLSACRRLVGFVRFGTRGSLSTCRLCGVIHASAAPSVAKLVTRGGAAVGEGDLHPVGSVASFDSSMDRVGVRMLSLRRGFPPVVDHGAFLACHSTTACRSTCFPRARALRHSGQVIAGAL